MKRTVIWTGALIAGALLGLIDSDWLRDTYSFVAEVFTRLFQLLAVPTIVLAVILTLANLKKNEGMGRIFLHTITYTLLTTLCASMTGLVLYKLIAPGNLQISQTTVDTHALTDAAGTSYYEHILHVIPDNIVRPFLEGNVMSLLLIAFAIGIALSRMTESERKSIVIKGLEGLQELLYIIIRGLVWMLPLGIVCYAALLTSQLNAESATDSLGRYVAVILSGNIIQFFVILPLFLLLRGINPLRNLIGMMPAVLTALFTKSSAATLPVTIQSAEERLRMDTKVTRFVLPICTTINMNGCATFILVTSLFIMQNSGMQPDTWQLALWIAISVITAIGNAGVPMGCFFLTLSLMTGIGANIGIMGLILPVYSILDMVETAENVWSDSCVCAMVDRDMHQRNGSSSVR